MHIVLCCKYIQLSKVCHNNVSRNVFKVLISHIGKTDDIHVIRNLSACLYCVYYIS